MDLLLIIIILLSTVISFYMFYLIGQNTIVYNNCNNIIELNNHINTAIINNDNNDCIDDNNVLLNAIANDNNNKKNNNETECVYNALQPVRVLPIHDSLLQQYRGDHLIQPRLSGASVLLTASASCHTLVNPSSSSKSSRQTCLAVTRIHHNNDNSNDNVNNVNSFLMLRRDQEAVTRFSLSPQLSSGTGVYRRSSGSAGRLGLGTKLSGLLAALDAVESVILQRLIHRGLLPDKHNDIIVMVLNDGNCLLIIMY